MAKNLHEPERAYSTASPTIPRSVLRLSERDLANSALTFTNRPSSNSRSPLVRARAVDSRGKFPEKMLNVRDPVERVRRSLSSSVFLVRTRRPSPAESMKTRAASYFLAKQSCRLANFSKSLRNTSNSLRASSRSRDLLSCGLPRGFSKILKETESLSLESLESNYLETTLATRTRRGGRIGAVDRSITDESRSIDRQLSDSARPGRPYPSRTPTW